MKFPYGPYLNNCASARNTFFFKRFLKVDLNVHSNFKRCIKRTVPLQLNSKKTEIHMYARAELKDFWISYPLLRI